jgi:hypothetical protein
MGVGSLKATPRSNRSGVPPPPFHWLAGKKGGYGLNETGGGSIVLPGQGRDAYLMKESVRIENAGCSEEVVVTYSTYKVSAFTHTKV